MQEFIESRPTHGRFSEPKAKRAIDKSAKYAFIAAMVFLSLMTIETYASAKQQQAYWQGQSAGYGSLEVAQQ